VEEVRPLCSACNSDFLSVIVFGEYSEFRYLKSQRKSSNCTQDRTNLGNARVAGLQKDLKMSDKEYSIALTVTYVPYIGVVLPSNLLLKVGGIYTRSGRDTKTEY
jgi:hypothetical protein